MGGVIAAGSQATVDAGAAILAAGGNATDAAVAACFATAVGEPTLTSLAGAGVMIHRAPDDQKVTVCDFFADGPLTPRSAVEPLDFFGVDLDFGPTTQRFYIGAASATVPGVIPGLCQILERWGSLRLADVIKPACGMMRDGRELGPYQGRAARLLEPILTYTSGARAIFAPNGAMIAAGDRFHLPQLADTLESLAAGDWRDYYEAKLVTAMLEQFGPHRGGLLTREDFDRYEVIFREPLRRGYAGCELFTNPPPAAGGPMIAMMLSLLDPVDDDLRRGSLAHIKALSCAMAVADEARLEGIDALEGDRLDHWHRRFQRMRHGELSAPPSIPARNCTTHVSVLDDAGGAASVTFSYGEGNAHIIGDSGIMMNNLLGEEDLFPGGFDSAPQGQRLPTMMSPTLISDPSGALTVMGTGGANRIRTAIVQVVSLLCKQGLDAEEAVAAARVHYENGVLNAEIFEVQASDAPSSPDVFESMETKQVVRFNEPNLFFGGVHLVRRSSEGAFSGAGDPRRGGAFTVVG
ncbi:MAG: gamma-glutamyltransferase [Polyangiaceae bacterium]